MAATWAWLAVLAAAASAAVYHWPSTHEQSPYGHPKQPWRSEAPADDLETGATARIIKDPLGVQLYVRHWKPEGQQPSAVLLMVHGATWHGKFFAPAAQYFVAQYGWAVLAVDLPSHGRSGSATGIKACHPTGMSAFAAAVGSVLTHIQQRLHPGVPTVVLGESMGGGVVLTALLEAQQQQQEGKEVPWNVQGVILSAAAVGVPTNMLPPAPVVKVLQALARVAPQLPIPDRAFSNKELWLKAFGDKQLAATIWEDDRHIMKHMPVCMVATLLPAFNWLEQHRRELQTPVLLLHGDGDIRVLPEISRQLHAELTFQDKTLKVYKGAAHQLFQETEGIMSQVMQDIGTWVQEQLQLPG